MKRRPHKPAVVADANVLYSNDQRNVLMTLATERLIDLRWTREIESEWVHALVRRMMKGRATKAPRATEAELTERFATTAGLMRKALPGHGVPGYEDHLARVPKADAKDRHVAAAAVGCAPSTLITWNLGDFDADELAALNVTLSDPDAFLCGLSAAVPELVNAAVVKSYGFVEAGHRRRGQAPPSWDAYLEILASRGSPNALPRFAALLRALSRDETKADDPVTEALEEENDQDDEPGP